MRNVTIQYKCIVNDKAVSPVVLERSPNFVSGNTWKEKKEVSLMGGSVVEASHFMTETLLSDEEIIREVTEGMETLLDDRYPYSEIVTVGGIQLTL